MTSQMMPHWLGQRAALTPHRTALIAEEEQWTFAELHERSLRIARHLAERGVQRGDHVALLLQNGIHSAAIYHALSYLGVVTVPLNTRLTATELLWQLKDAEVQLLIHAEQYLQQVQVIGKSFPDVRTLASGSLLASGNKTDQQADMHQLGGQDRDQSSDLRGGGDEHIQTELDLEDTHSIIYTSGTTGRPKGVLLTYGNHWWSALGSALNLGLHEQDRWLACLPFFHVSGMSILMRSIIYGIPVIVHETFDPEAVNRDIFKHKVTLVSVVSSMLSRMLVALEEDTYPDTLRCMLLGGGPAPRPLLEDCVRRHIPVFQTYGLTETASQIVTLAPEYMLSKLGSAGKPLFPAQLRIEKEGKLLSSGEVGEVTVRGPNVTQGYFKREDATKQALRNGWLHTGDLGYVDDEGFLYVLDRRHDLIISGGENVYPAEVESVLVAHPGIADAGVTGVEDERWGQVPIAFVTLKNGEQIEEEEVLDFCRGRLAKYKVPVRVYVVERLPRNATNKLLRRELLKLRA